MIDVDEFEGQIRGAYDLSHVRADDVISLITELRRLRVIASGNQGAIVNSIIERTRHTPTDEMLPGPSDAAREHLGEWRERRNTRTDNERLILGDIWDDGNAVGLDGWVGPGPGTEPIDDYAVQARERAIEKFAAALRRTEVPEPSAESLAYYDPARQDRISEHDCVFEDGEWWFGHGMPCKHPNLHAEPQGEPSAAQRYRAAIEDALPMIGLMRAWNTSPEQIENVHAILARALGAARGVR